MSIFTHMKPTAMPMKVETKQKKKRSEWSAISLPFRVLKKYGKKCLRFYPNYKYENLPH